MGKKEFANQQPTQNLAGRGSRGTGNAGNAAHTAGNRRRVRAEPVFPLRARPWSSSPDPQRRFSPLPPLASSLKLRKHGLPKSQPSAGQVPLAANVQANKKKTQTHTEESSVQVQSCDSHGNSRR